MRYGDKWILSWNHPDNNSVNDIQAVLWVSKFCVEYKYDVVVTSSWRLCENYAECLFNAGFDKSIRIQGCVEESASRSEAIRNYISSHSDIEMYLIFDDESINELKDHLILCEPRRGFGEIEYNRAVRLHKRFDK